MINFLIKFQNKYQNEEAYEFFIKKTNIQTNSNEYLCSMFIKNSNNNFSKKLNANIKIFLDEYINNLVIKRRINKKRRKREKNLKYN